MVKGRYVWKNVPLQQIVQENQVFLGFPISRQSVYDKLSKDHGVEDINRALSELLGLVHSQDPDVVADSEHMVRFCGSSDARRTSLRVLQITHTPSCRRDYFIAYPDGGPIAYVASQDIEFGGENDKPE